MGIGREIDKGAKSSTERYRELVDKYNKHIESNSASISNNYANLHSDYIANIPNTDHILLTIQQTSRRGRNISLAIEGITSTEESASANWIPPNCQPVSICDTTQVFREID